MKRIILIIALALPLISLSQVNKSIIDTSKTWYNGVSHLIEVKNGPSAGFTPNQKIVYPKMIDGIPITPRGANANYVWPGQVGQPTTEYYLIIIKY
ncbi:MAG: hypothetical protein ACK5MH_06000 [Bacteroidales bacterium]